MNTITLQLTDDQVEQLRTEIDRIPLTWAPLVITKILPQLPFTEFAAGRACADSSSAPSPPSGVAGGFLTRRQAS